MEKPYLEKITQIGAGTFLAFMLAALCISSFAFPRPGDSNEALIETGGKAKPARNALRRMKSKLFRTTCDGAEAMI